MAVDPKIKQKAEDIRKKIFGSEVRESLASGLEGMSEDVESIKGRQDTVETTFQEVIDETTDKDVISAPEIIAARGEHSNLSQRLLSADQQLAETANNITGYEFEIKRSNDKITGWELNKQTSIEIAHDDNFSVGNKTIDLLVGLSPYEVYQQHLAENAELHLVNKPDTFVIKMMSTPTQKFVVDVNNGSSWMGEITSKTKFNFLMKDVINVEDYGVSQGLTTDGEYIYTSNNRLDKNPYHVHKRKKDGTLIKGIILEEGYGHPCGMCVVGGLLYVPANDFNNGNSDNHRVYVIDTSTMEIIDTKDFTYASGGGISGIAYHNGYFYASDWQTLGLSYITKYDKNFNAIETKPIPLLKIQGIDIAGDKLIFAENNTNTICVFDLHDLSTRKEDYSFHAEIEGEDLCVTPEGTILHGDVNTIREYKILTDWNSTENTAFLRFTVTFEVVGTNTNVGFYINGIKQGEKVIAGTVNIDNRFGLFVNGNGVETGIRRTTFKLKSFGISNNIKIPTLNMREVFDKSRYEELFVDCGLNASEVKDLSSKNHSTSIVGNPIYNYTNNIF